MSGLIDRSCVGVGAEVGDDFAKCGWSARVADGDYMARSNEEFSYCMTNHTRANKANIHCNFGLRCIPA